MCVQVEHHRCVHTLQFEETLTGFKWIGNRSCDLTAQGACAMPRRCRPHLIVAGYNVLFSYEEAIGFCMGSTNVDKVAVLVSCSYSPHRRNQDGISAAVAMTEFVQHLAAQGLLLSEHLAQLYHKYGYHCMYNSYYICRCVCAC